MAEITPRTGTTLSMTARWLIAIAVVALIASAFACAKKVLEPTGDEPPIRVRNGSMEVVLTAGEWRDDGDAWSPSTGRGSGRFLVKVQSGRGYKCEAEQTGSGREVWVSYSDKTEVTFRSAGSSGKTKVQPRNALVRARPELLQYGQASDKEYITGVGVRDGGNTWSCAFADRVALAEIIICPAQNPACR